MSIVNNSNNVYETYYKSDIFNQNKGVFSTREKYNPIQYTLKYSDVCKYKDPTYQYNPDVHYLRSQFNKEQNERKELKRKHIPPRERPRQYSIEVINYRKYGSNLDEFYNGMNMSTKMKKQRSDIALNNSANLRYDETISHRDMKIIMNQSNIFGDNEKDNENKKYKQKVLSKSVNVSPKQRTTITKVNNNDNSNKKVSYHGKRKTMLLAMNDIHMKYKQMHSGLNKDNTKCCVNKVLMNSINNGRKLKRNNVKQKVFEFEDDCSSVKKNTKWRYNNEISVGNSITDINNNNISKSNNNNISNIILMQYPQSKYNMHYLTKVKPRLHFRSRSVNNITKPT